MGRIRWRLNDPAEESRQRWTKVHRFSFARGYITACNITIPEQPYMEDRDDQIPPDADVCKRCERADRREAA